MTQYKATRQIYRTPFLCFAKQWSDIPESIRTTFRFLLDEQVMWKEADEIAARVERDGYLLQPQQQLHRAN